MINRHIQDTLDGIDQALAEYYPIVDPDVMEEEERKALHELVAEGWIAGDEEQLVFEWFSRHRKH